MFLLRAKLALRKEKDTFFGKDLLSEETKKERHDYEEQ